jgi:hypothetical protein
MPAVDAHAQVLEQAHLAPAGAVPLVACERDEVEVVDDRQRPGEIGDEDERRLQGGDEDWLQPLVVGGDLRSELLDARLNLLGGEIDLADPRVR